MDEEIKVGSKIPPFFLKDQEGFDVSDGDVAGTPVVMYFYPKDGTSGCTEEALSFHEKMEKFDLLQTLVIGISPDSVDSHKKFIKENKLEFSLLSDEKKDMCKMFGVLNERGEVIRTTLVVDSSGVVKWIEKPVSIKGHVDRVLKAVEKNCKEEVLNFEDFERDYEDFLRGGLNISEEEKRIHQQIMEEFGIKKSDIEDKKK